MRIAIYSRKSKLTETGDSIANQITMCKEYANLHFPNSTFTTFEDEGFSGGNTQRPMFKKLIQDIKNKNFDILICYRLDRISRNVADFSNTLELLQSHKVNFVSIKENFDTSTPMGRAMMYISSVFAQLERDTIAERITDNLLQLAKDGNGRYLGGTAPYGFYKVRKSNLEGKLYSALVVSPKESENVKIIFNKYIELESLRRLESYLFINGIKTRNNCNFNTHNLGLLLRRPHYVYADKAIYTYFKNLGVQLSNSQLEFNGKNGVIVFGRSGKGKGEISKLNEPDKWVVGVGQHTGIIESSKWLHVQNILDSKKNKSLRHTHNNYGLLNGLLKCKLCGDYMRPSSVKNKGSQFYYVCITKEKSRKTKCNNKNIRGNTLDKDIIIKLNNELKYNDIKVHNILKKQSVLIKEISQSNKKEKQLQNQLNENKQSIKNLVNKLSKNLSFTVEGYITAEIELLDKKNKEIETELLKLLNDKDKIAIESSNTDTIKQYAENIMSLNYLANDILPQKKLLKTIIKSIEWDGKKISINFFV